MIKDVNHLEDTRVEREGIDPEKIEGAAYQWWESLGEPEARQLAQEFLLCMNVTMNAAYKESYGREAAWRVIREFRAWLAESDYCRTQIVNSISESEG